MGTREWSVCGGEVVGGGEVRVGGRWCGDVGGEWWGGVGVVWVDCLGL